MLKGKGGGLFMSWSQADSHDFIIIRIDYCAKDTTIICSPALATKDRDEMQQENTHAVSN